MAMIVSAFNRLKTVRKNIFEGIRELFSFGLSYEETKYIYRKHLKDNDLIKTDWENVGRDIQNAMDHYEKIIDEKEGGSKQYTLNFDGVNNGKQERKPGEKQHA